MCFFVQPLLLLRAAEEGRLRTACYCTASDFMRYWRIGGHDAR